MSDLSTPGSVGGTASREAGDRRRFLAPIRRATEVAGVSLGPHPPPPPLRDAPLVAFRVLDDAPDLVALFVESARAAATEVHLTPGQGVPADVLSAIVADYGVGSAVVSREPVARAVSGGLRGLGVSVADYSPTVAATSDLGVTSAVAGIAVTGSIVVDTDHAGSRAASLLPRVHLCVLAASMIVATPGDVLRGNTGTTMPSARAIITGPSRTGDIEQVITLGAHGPTALILVLTEADGRG